MKYNQEWLLAKTESGETIKYIFFWGHQPNKTGKITASCFSQWYLAEFKVNDIVFKTSEHWMMAEKARLFGDLKSYELIIHSRSPGDAKDLGRRITGFNESLWLEKRFEIVVEGNYHKFNQNEKLKELLITTQDRVLVEASPVDPIWGIGLAKDNENVENPKEWKGLNLLGFALMEVRDRLRN